MNPPDIVPDDADRSFTFEDNEEALDLDSDEELSEIIDNPKDRIMDAKLIGRKICGYYGKSWHTELLVYFDTYASSIWPDKIFFVQYNI